jgi:hypothetical protein
LFALLAALLLTLAAVVGTVRGGGATINLDPGDVGTNSLFFKMAPCGGVVGAGLIEWEFELTAVTPGLTSALTMNATFSGDGAQAVASTWDVTGATHTFLAYTTGNDTVTAASVVVPNAAGALNLVGLCSGPAATPEASLQDAATSSTTRSSPTLAFFGLLLLGLGALVAIRVRTRTEG